MITRQLFPCPRPCSFSLTDIVSQFFTFFMRVFILYSCGSSFASLACASLSYSLTCASRRTPKESYLLFSALHTETSVVNSFFLCLFRGVNLHVHFTLAQYEWARSQHEFRGEEITKQDIDEFGATVGCWLQRNQRQLKGAQARSDRCRVRIEQGLRITPQGAEGLDRRSEVINLSIG